jgi:hypothetical protein
MKENGGTITSSPGPNPAIMHATCRGDVPLFMPTADGYPSNAAKFLSKSSTSFPRQKRVAS